MIFIDLNTHTINNLLFIIPSINKKIWNKSNTIQKENNHLEKMALYSAIQYANDLKTCLRISANHSGDSDSVACIAGSILGAFYGMSIILKDWLDCLAEKERMETFLSKVIEFFKK